MKLVFNWALRWTNCPPAQCLHCNGRLLTLTDWPSSMLLTPRRPNHRLQ
jgi:hypothetical protein